MERPASSATSGLPTLPQSPLLFDANGCRNSSEPISGPVVGNARTHIFEWAACPYYSAISPDNRFRFPVHKPRRQRGTGPPITVRDSLAEERQRQPSLRKVTRSMLYARIGTKSGQRMEAAVPIIA
jgi:hypothetical protein